MDNQLLKKSFFWIIATLLVTTIFIGGLIGALITFAFSLFIKILNVDLSSLLSQIISSLFYFVGLIAGLKIGVKYFIKHTVIGKRELRKIILIFGLFPIVSYLLLSIPIQMYLGGTELVMGMFLLSWEEITSRLIIWLLVTIIAFLWFNKMSVPEITFTRKRITNSEKNYISSLAHPYFWCFLDLCSRNERRIERKNR